MIEADYFFHLKRLHKLRVQKGTRSDLTSVNTDYFEIKSIYNRNKKYVKKMKNNHLSSKNVQFSQTLYGIKKRVF